MRPAIPSLVIPPLVIPSLAIAAGAHGAAVDTRIFDGAETVADGRLLLA
jgi:hypothetical protein